MPQMIVLDTHIWLWLVTQDWQMFPATWREEIETAERVGVSPISCYEIVLAEERGRLELPCAAEDWFRDALAPMDIVLLPLTAEIACRAVGLSAVHRIKFSGIDQDDPDFAEIAAAIRAERNHTKKRASY